jgi:hypothetical protein
VHFAAVLASVLQVQTQEEKSDADSVRSGQLMYINSH